MLYLAPFDVILSALIFETPYIFTKFGSMFVALVTERTYMVSIPQFERSVTKSDVCFLCGFCGDLSLVNDVFHVAVSIHGTRVRFPTIAASLSLITSACGFVNFGFVMVRYDCFDVAHAAVAQFEGVTVKNFVKRVRFGEVLIN